MGAQGMSPRWTRQGRRFMVSTELTAFIGDKTRSDDQEPCDTMCQARPEFD